MNNNFSANLKKIRKDHNLSQEQLAEEIGVSRQAISKWESAIAYPEMDKIIALCDKFDLNIDDLLHKDIREIKGEEERKKKLNKSIDDFLKYITNTINLFSNMNFKSKIKCLFEQIIIILILLLLSTIVFGFTSSFLSHLFVILPDNINYFIRNIFDFIIMLFCLIVSIVIFTHIFKARYLDYYDKLKDELKNNDEKSDIIEKEDKEISITKKNKILFKNNENKIIIRDPKYSEYRFINGLFKFIVGIIKFFALCFSLLLCFILVCLFGAFIISFLSYKTGLFFVGLLGIILSSSIIDIILLLIIFNFVFNRKNDKKKMIWSFIFSLIIFGISCGMIFIGTLNFEVLNNNETMLKTDSIELDMRDNMFFNIYPEVKYVESNIDNVKIEYKINKYCELEKTDYDNYGIHIWAYCSNPIKLTKEFIKNINNNKIIPINNEIQDVIIYTSKENIEVLKQNEEKYYKEQQQYNDIINSYEKEISEYQSQLDESKTKNYEYENKILELEEEISILKENYIDN